MFSRILVLFPLVAFAVANPLVARSDISALQQDFSAMETTVVDIQNACDKFKATPDQTNAMAKLPRENFASANTAFAVLLTWTLRGNFWPSSIILSRGFLPFLTSGPLPNYARCIFSASLPFLTYFLFPSPSIKHLMYCTEFSYCIPSLYPSFQFSLAEVPLSSEVDLFQNPSFRYPENGRQIRVAYDPVHRKYNLLRLFAVASGNYQLQYMSSIAVV
ncbi:hypothetical protein ARMSODRAFT_1009862 [Armillaria solidipes]|uniref:Uncharacterized protein n=1 Tax=Armillaria solidipes TaxID=1076256 RepID=A0A2H3B3D6_9AGAR|nr:hypothetical protein ARMSODRAFT_1009862 [Armillaria solidipes]